MKTNLSIVDLVYSPIESAVSPKDVLNVLKKNPSYSAIQIALALKDEANDLKMRFVHFVMYITNCINDLEEENVLSKNFDHSIGVDYVILKQNQLCL